MSVTFHLYRICINFFLKWREKIVGIKSTLGLKAWCNRTFQLLHKVLFAYWKFVFHSSIITLCCKTSVEQLLQNISHVLFFRSTTYFVYIVRLQWKWLDKLNINRRLICNEHLQNEFSSLNLLPILYWNHSLFQCLSNDGTAWLKCIFWHLLRCVPTVALFWTKSCSDNRVGVFCGVIFLKCYVVNMSEV